MIEEKEAVIEILQDEMKKLTTPIEELDLNKEYEDNFIPESAITIVSVLKSISELPVSDIPSNGYLINGNLYVCISYDWIDLGTVKGSLY